MRLIDADVLIDKYGDWYTEEGIIACDAHGELIIGYLEYRDEQWLCESDAEMMYDPIVWMEKPEPYKGDRDR